MFELTYDPTTGKTGIETWVQQVDNVVEEPPTETKPSAFSFLKSDHCFGSEQVHSIFSNGPHSENYWLPEFIS